MKLDVLGEMCVDGDPNIFPARDRAVLAALAMCPGTAVTADRLADAMWGEHRPVSWSKVIPGCVMRLRRALGASAIETTRNGYRLTLEADAVDVQRFVRLATSGHELLEGGESARAADLIGEALAMWRGAAFIDLNDWEPRVAEARRLEEIRFDAQEEFVEACQRAGRHREVLAFAQWLVTEMPFRERRWALLAGAQYRAGRQTDALRTLHDARTMLAAELGVDPGSELVELEHAILRHDPALAARNDRPLLGDVDGASVDTPGSDERIARAHSRTNLPTPATSLIDRDDRLTVAMRLVENCRFVTLTGTGGVGKTRLAVELGWACLDQFPSGVWVVELAPVMNADSVVAAVAATLSIPPQQGLTFVESIVDWFRGRELLLIIDNCEHVLDAVRHLLKVVLARCPTLKVIATSREFLGLAGERVHHVDVLQPDSDGVALFLERAAAVDSTFVPSRVDQDAIADICRRLDGLPLAIELAAARVHSMAPIDLLARLDDRFELLRRGTRLGDDHHETLRATVEWSYQLLTEQERAVFDRLSVFSGSFDLRAAEMVCADTVEESDVFELLANLVDKSMILIQRGSGGTRYDLLETLRQFGGERLRARDQTAVARERHLCHYVDVAEQADTLFRSSGEVIGAATFSREWDNLRSAHEWAILTLNLALAERLILSSFMHAVSRMQFEHGDWAEGTIALSTSQRQPSPYTFAQGAHWAFANENMARAAELLVRGIDVAVDMTDPGVAQCLVNLDPGDDPRVPDPLRQLEIAATKLDLDREWWLLIYLPDAAAQYDPASEPVHVARLVEAAERIGAPKLRVGAALALAHLSIMRKPPDFAAALDLYAPALVTARQSGDQVSEGDCLRSIALATVGLHADEAIEACREALISLYDIRYWYRIWQLFESIGLALASTGHIEVATILTGHLEAHHSPFGNEHQLGFRARSLAIVQADPQIHEWMARGAAMDRHQIVEFALAALEHAMRV